MTGFPVGFLWGAATAGHQVEGGNVNADLWPMEWAPNSTFNEPSGDTCDHYHRYPEDIATLAELGLTAYRFSLEWSRIEPEPGFYSLAALDHYKRMIESCLQQGVTPVVTYNHFTVPRWMAGRGGWSASGRSGALRRLRLPRDGARGRPPVVGLHLERTEPHGDDAEHRRAGHGRRRSAAETRRGRVGAGRGGGLRPGALPDGDRRRRRRTDGHGPSPGGPGHQGSRRLRQDGLDPGARRLPTGARAARSGGARRGEWARPTGSPSPPTTTSSGCRPTRGSASGRTASFLRPTGRPPCRPGGRSTPKHSATPSGWPRSTPGCRCSSPRTAWRRTTTRRGSPTPAPRWRAWPECSADGIDVRGYIHWTLLDNFEWNAGYSKTFGLIAVDRQDFARTVKPSARWLGQVARRNGLD